MKKSMILAAAALVAVVGCNKFDNKTVATDVQKEMSFVAMNGANVSRGYSVDGVFAEVTYENLVTSPSSKADRTMQLSAYLTPQNGEAGNYFVGKTFAKGENDLWHATPDPVYWPLGGTLEFLAYSITSEAKNVTVAWDNENAASKVVLNVPGENTQNDILFASVAPTAPQANAVPMHFNHAQAWLQFNLKAAENDIVTLEKIVLEDVYNAGELTISNNRGNAIAEWTFAGQPKDIEVDNYRSTPVTKLTTEPSELDMLIPQQKKTAFVIYYTMAGIPQVQSYRFTTDLKTWLMGEKYIYNIRIATNEITVEPDVESFAEHTHPETFGNY